jgi:hypothetical protein
MALFHEPRPTAPFMVMTAYLDESGTHGGQSPAVLMGGFLAGAAGWAAYEKSLKYLLDSHGVGLFHAKKLRARRGEFAEWSDSQFRIFVTDFFKIVSTHLAYGFAASVTPRDYRNIYKAEGLPRKVRQDTEYGVCFRMCLTAALQFVSNFQRDWPLFIVLEGGHKNCNDAVRIYQEIKSDLSKNETYGNILGSITIETKRDCLPLAAADALAHSYFRLKSGKLTDTTTNRRQSVTVSEAVPTQASFEPRIQLFTINEATLLQMRDALLQGR